RRSATTPIWPKGSTHTAASSPTARSPKRRGSPTRPWPRPWASRSRLFPGNLRPGRAYWVRREGSMNRALAPALLSAAALVVSAGRAAETRIEKTLKLSPGGELRLETDMGKVTVTGSTEPDAHVIITSRRKELEELMTFRFDEGANGVTITARKRHKFDWL